MYILDLRFRFQSDLTLKLFFGVGRLGAVHQAVNGTSTYNRLGKLMWQTSLQTVAYLHIIAAKGSRGVQLDPLEMLHDVHQLVSNFVCWLVMGR